MGAVKPDLYPEQIGGGGGKTGELSISWKVTGLNFKENSSHFI